MSKNSWSENPPTIPGDYWFAYKYGDDAGTVEYRQVDKDYTGKLCVYTKRKEEFWGPDPIYTALYDTGWWMKAELPEFPFKLMEKE